MCLTAIGLIDHEVVPPLPDFLDSDVSEKAWSQSLSLSKKGFTTKSQEALLL